MPQDCPDFAPPPLLSEPLARLLHASAREELPAPGEPKRLVHMHGRLEVGTGAVLFRCRYLAIGRSLGRYHEDNIEDIIPSEHDVRVRRLLSMAERRGGRRLCYCLVPRLAFAPLTVPPEMVEEHTSTPTVDHLSLAARPNPVTPADRNRPATFDDLHDSHVRTYRAWLAHLNEYMTERDTDANEPHPVIWLPREDWPRDWPPSIHWAAQLTMRYLPFEEVIPYAREKLHAYYREYVPGKPHEDGRGEYLTKRRLELAKLLNAMGLPAPPDAAPLADALPATNPAARETGLAASPRTKLVMGPKGRLRTRKDMSPNTPAPLEYESTSSHGPSPADEQVMKAYRDFQTRLEQEDTDD